MPRTGDLPMTPLTFEQRARATFQPIARLTAVVLGGLMALASACSAQSTPPTEDAASKQQAYLAAGGTAVTALDPQVNVVFQAKDQTLWFGSYGQGVYRYDGKTILHFTTEHGLAGNYVRAIQEDRVGNIYVCSDPEGISRFDGHVFRTLRAAETEPSESEWGLEPDDLWFPGGNDSRAVYRYDGETLHRLAFPKTKAGEDHYAKFPRSQYPAMKYSPYDVYTIFKDSNGHVWFGTATLGVCRYDGKSFAWADNTEIGLGANGNFGVRSIIEDPDGKFWFTTTSNRYDAQPSTTPGTGELSLRKEPGIDPAKDSIQAFVSSVKDKNGHLWLATLGDGVWRYDGKEVTHYPVTDDGKPFWVYSIYQDAQGGLWVGTQGHGVYKFNGKSFEKFEP
ncbi:MAG: hypothetical protein EYC70_13340 [Planctomycetota bacterium]|nr:MAG: hypothetical protein EYC70_13340 [Planctomycetota bacterium]